MYELPEFEYFEPETVGEAIEILKEIGPKAKILAGGTDLLGLMKDRISGREMPLPSALVNVKKIKELRVLEHSETCTTLGAALTLREIYSDNYANQRFPALSEACESVGTNQIQNMGTLGGNLCQRPWCWYFRHPAFDCFKKGGKQCYAITGNNSTYFSVYNLGTCVMSHPSDTAPALIALEANATIADCDGYREIPLSEFFLGGRNVNDNILRSDQILVNVKVPLPRRNSKSVYIKHRTRNTWDFALASVAAVGSLSVDGTVDFVRIVLGGVAPLPIVLREVDRILSGSKYAQKAREQAVDAVVKQAKPLRMNGYKVRIVKAIVRRALDSVLS